MGESESGREESDELENRGSAKFHMVENLISDAEAALGLRTNVAVRQDLFLVSGVK